MENSYICWKKIHKIITKNDRVTEYVAKNVPKLLGKMMALYNMWKKYTKIMGKIMEMSYIIC